MEYFIIFIILPDVYIFQSEKFIFLIPAIIIFLGMLQYFLLERKIQKKEIDFSIYFIAVNGAKFILLLFGILLYLVYVSKNSKEFISIFFINYFFSISLVNSMLVYLLKKNK
jgi:hypothetical protein